MLYSDDKTCNFPQNLHQHDAKQKTVTSSFLLLQLLLRCFFLFLYIWVNHLHELLIFFNVFFWKGCENKLHSDPQPAGRAHYPTALADYFYVKCECEN